MTNNNNRPSDFNLFLASKALLGMLSAMHELMADAPETEPERTRWLDSLTGLAWAGRNIARQMNAFLAEASETHRFPARYADVDSEPRGVRETPPLYLAR